MLRKLLVMLLVLMLLPFACAEETAENPFLGAWRVMYYIINGSTHTPEELNNTDMLMVTEEAVSAWRGEEEISATSYEIDGAILRGEELVLRLEGEDLLVCEDDGLSVLLVRIDPIALNNPFIGTWEVLYFKAGSTIRDAVEFATYEGLALPAAGEFVLPITFDAGTAVFNYQVYRCTYADGACTIYNDAGIEAICTIAEDGLLHLSHPEDADLKFVCARENEQVSEDISQFYGLWREIALIYDGMLTTDQQPALESGVLFQFDFSRGLVRRTCETHLDFPASWIPLTYQDGACTILYDNSPARCTIDANGLMCIRAEDGSGVSWLVRADLPAESADAE